MENESITLEVDISPLSVNKCWQGRRFKTTLYKNWLKEIAFKLKRSLRMPDTKDWLYMEVEFHIKNIKMADIDNPMKPLLDSLTHNGIIKDDRYIKRQTVEKFKVDNKEDEKIIVRLSKY